VEVGDVVKEGQLLVEIYPSTQQAKLDAGRFSIENLKVQLPHANHCFLKFVFRFSQSGPSNNNYH